MNHSMDIDFYDNRPFRIKRRRWTMRQTKILILMFYLIAVPTYVFIGLQPSTRSVAETLAAEAEGASGYLMISGINLSSPVAEVSLEDRTLSVPEYIAGSYSNHKNKTLIIGHSSTVFENLKDVKFGQAIDYNEHTYRVTNIETRLKEKISMSDILKEEKNDTIILMTCAGQSLGGNDYSHRLIITAEAVE